LLPGAMTAWQVFGRIWLLTNPLHPNLWRHVWVMYEGVRWWSIRWHLQPRHWLQFWGTGWPVELPPDDGALEALWPAIVSLLEQTKDYQEAAGSLT
jgi:hypothetical protein